MPTYEYVLPGLRNLLSGIDDDVDYPTTVGERKHWSRKYEFEQVWETDEIGLYSMTPIHLSKWLFNQIEVKPGDKVLETCAGVGADTVILARMEAQVVSFEPDAERYRMAQLNIKNFVPGKKSVTVIRTNCILDKSLTNKCDVVFVDAPWGGKSYKKWIRIKELFVGNWELGDIAWKLLEGRKRDLKLVYKLPPNYDYKTLLDTCLRAGSEEFGMETCYLTPPSEARPRMNGTKIPNIRWLVVKYIK
uniref:Methyltransferase n=1 Tax=viral metagenome TaxID=1070528 RepID=A0A6C0KD38_9ZZZZ